MRLQLEDGLEDGVILEALPGAIAVAILVIVAALMVMVVAIMVIVAVIMAMAVDIMAMAVDITVMAGIGAAIGAMVMAGIMVIAASMLELAGGRGGAGVILTHIHTHTIILIPTMIRRPQ